MKYSNMKSKVFASPYNASTRDEKKGTRCHFRGWKIAGSNTKVSDRCICGDERNCKRVMKEYIEKGDDYRCTLVRLKKKKTESDTIIDLRKRIIEIFGVDEDEYSESTIMIRPHHFHRSCLQASNQGPIKPLVDLQEYQTEHNNREEDFTFIGGYYFPVPRKERFHETTLCTVQPGLKISTTSIDEKIASPLRMVTPMTDDHADFCNLTTPQKGEDSPSSLSFIHETAEQVSALDTKSTIKLSSIGQTELAEVSKFFCESEELRVSGCCDLVRVLRKSSLERLQNQTAWLDAEIIQAYVDILNKNEQIRNTEHPCWVFDSYFLTHLIKDTGIDLSMVKRFHKKVTVTNGNIFGLEMLLIVVHRDSNHWALLVIFFEEKKVRYYDSMNKDGRRYFDPIMAFLGAESDRQDLKFSKDSWLFENFKEAPQQSNSWDCGVFVCMAMQQILDHDRNKTISNNVMPSQILGADPKEIEKVGRACISLTLIRSSAPALSIKPSKRPIPASSEKATSNLNPGVRMKHEDMPSRLVTSTPIQKKDAQNNNPLDSDGFNCAGHFVDNTPSSDRFNASCHFVEDDLATNKLFKRPIPDSSKRATENLNPSTKLKEGSAFSPLSKTSRAIFHASEDFDTGIQDKKSLEYVKSFIATMKGCKDEDTSLKCFDRGRFQRLVYPKGGGREADARNILLNVLEVVSKAMMPSFHHNDRMKFCVDALSTSKYGRRKNEPFLLEGKKARIGEEVCEWISSKKKPVERRPMLAFMRKAGITKNEANILVNKKIQKREWAEAGAHVKFPGAGEPIAYCHPVRRMAVDFSVTNTAMSMLQKRGMIEDTAFGVKNVKDCTGRCTQIESIKRTDTKQGMYRTYVKDFIKAIIPEDGNGKWWSC